MSDADSEQHERRAPGGYPAVWHAFWLPLLVIAAVILLMVAAFARHAYDQQANVGWTVVDAVAEVKVQQVSAWLTERVYSASLHATSFPQADLYARWRNEDDEAAARLLFRRLTDFSRAGQFSAVMLLDSAGQVLWASDPAIFPTDERIRAAWIEAAVVEPAGFVGPYRDRGGELHLDFVSVLPTGDGADRPIVVLRAGQEHYLPDTIRDFPFPGTSGEVVLFRRNGPDVVILSALQEEHVAPLSMRLPRTKQDILAVQLASSSGSDLARVTGVDYRGVPAFGTGAKIAGSDWFLVAKMDASEVWKGSLETTLWAAVLGVLVFLAIAALLVLARQQRRLTLLAGEQTAQEERLRAMQLLGAVADSSSDAIYVKDLEGRYLLFNRAASDFTGKSPEEVLGRDDRYLFPAEQAEMLREIHRQVLSDNRTVTNRETLDSTRGQRVMLATKGPVHNEIGEIVGVYGIARDVTEREEAATLLEEKTRDLARRNEELERFNQAMVGRELDMLRLKREINQLCRELGRPLPYGREVLGDSGMGPGETPATVGGQDHGGASDR